MNIVLLAGSQTEPSSTWNLYTNDGKRITNVLSVALHLLPSRSMPLVEIKLGLATGPMQHFAPVQFDGIVAGPVQLAQLAQGPANAQLAQVLAHPTTIWIAVPSDFLRCAKYQGDT